MYKLASDTWDSRELKALDSVISSNQYTMGPKVSGFEDELSHFLGVQHSIMTNSGSSANLVAAFSLRYSSTFKYNINRNVVLVPAVSWSTTFFPLHQAGFRLRFVDIDLNTLNISIKGLSQALDDSVCGVCFVSLLGNSAGLEEARRFCNTHGVWLMEDNCESFGATTEEKRKAGSVGDINTHSFFYSHHLQTMEGGMVSTNIAELAQVARSLRAHGWTRDKKSGNISKLAENDFQSSYEFVLPGFCVRPIEFMGAVGSVQLTKWETMLSLRQQNAALFLEIMKRFDGKCATQKTQDTQSSWFGFSIILSGSFEGQRKRLLEILREANIEYRPIVAGNFTRQPVMELLNAETNAEYPNADSLHDNGLFVGNDSRDLTRELELLEKCLGDFFDAQ